MQDKYVLMSLAILCIISIWHAAITILPMAAMPAMPGNASSLVNGTTGNGNSTAGNAQTSVNSSSPDLLRQSLQRASSPNAAFFFPPSSTSVPNRQSRGKRKWTPFGYDNGRSSFPGRSTFNIYCKARWPRGYKGTLSPVRE